MSIVLADFDTRFAARLAHRAATFRAAIASLGERPTIVETGCLRALDNWTGDGQSTVVLDAVAQATGGTLWSVDKEVQSIAVAKPLTTSTIYVWGESVDFLSRFPCGIDFLYLDSNDDKEHSLAELKAAWPRLQSGSVVSIDDTFISNKRIGGKGELVVPFMQETGAKLIAHDYQHVWII